MFVGEGPCHVPYLKRLSADGADPDPSNPDYQSSKGCWVFENMMRKEGGTIAWDTPVRIRYFNTLRFNSHSLIGPPHLTN